MCISRVTKISVIAITISMAAIGAESEKTVRMSFHSAPWKSVLAELAKAANLSFSPQELPPGTFSYLGQRQMSVSEAIDVVNNYLLVEGYTLLRNRQTLLLVRFETDRGAAILRNLIAETSVDDLTKRGDYEITKTRFTLQHINTQTVDQPLRELLTPVGSMIVLHDAQQIIVTETGRTLRTIHEIIQKLEHVAEQKQARGVHAFRLKNATLDQFLEVARPLLSIRDGENVDVDGTLHISTTRQTVYAVGPDDKIRMLQQIVKQVDATAEPTATNRQADNVRVVPMSDDFKEIAIEFLKQSWVGEQYPIRVIDLDRRPNVWTLRPRQKEDESLPIPHPPLDDFSARRRVFKINSVAAQSAPGIVISQTADGLMMMGSDETALDSIESFVKKLVVKNDRSPKFQLAYLKYIKAEAAKEMLTEILHGKPVLAEATPISVPRVDVENAAVGGKRCDISSEVSLAGGVAMSTDTRSLHIVADKRLNALVIQGNPAEVQNVRQLLEVIDRDAGPEEVFTSPIPRFIHVYHTSAESAAQVVKEVFADRLFSSDGRTGANVATGANAHGREKRRLAAYGMEHVTEAHGKMTIGIDSDNRALVVVAPTSLFQQVEAMVRKIDDEAADNGPHSYSISTLNRVNLLSIKQALSVFGDQVTFSGSATFDSPAVGEQQNGSADNAR